MIAAFVLGLATGMRTFTGLAVFSTARAWPLAPLFFIAAAGEYAADLFPQTPDRTSPPSLAARLGVGLAVGWLAAGVAGTLVAALGTLVGAFGGLQLRRALIARLGALPAGLLESGLAAGLAVSVASLPKTNL